MKLNEEQAKQVRKQLATLRNRKDAVERIILDRESGEHIDLMTSRNVFASNLFSGAVYLSRFLFRNKELYAGQRWLDMGCGPGTMGLIMAKYWAREVDFADLNPDALANTEVNIRLLNLSSDDCRVLTPGDLFEGFSEGRGYDGIIFNYPFFPANAEEFGQDANPDLMLRKSMLAGTDLVPRFFADAPKYLVDDGRVIVTYWHFAGPENEPVPHAERNGFHVELEERVKPHEGLQIGKDDISIYVFRRGR